MQSFDATWEFPEIAAQLGGAAEELQHHRHRNEQLAAEFEGRGWTGLVDRVNDAAVFLNAASDKLTDVAEKVGMAQIVKDARSANRMVGTRDTLGR